MTRARTSVAVAAGAIALGGCETHTVTRPPDPPIGAFGWLLVWLAIGSVGALWVAHAQRLLVGRRVVSFDRQVLGAAYLTTVAYLAGWVGFTIVSERRVDAILGSAGCRAIAQGERPRQIVQLTCSDAFDGGELLVAFVVLPGLVIGLALAVMSLRGDARPWLPTVTAGAGIVGLIALIAESGGTWTASQAALWTAGLVVAVAATVCGSREAQREPPVASPVVAAPGPAPTGPVAATLADRFQALVIDALAIAIPLSVLGANTAGAVEGTAIVATIAAYSVVCTIRWGQTFGKRVLRLQILATGTESPPGLTAAVVRLLALGGIPVLVATVHGTGLLFLAWAVVLVAPAFSGDRRPAHDRIAGTLVVRRTG